MNAADWEGRAIHYERPVQKLTSFSLKHYQIIFRQYFFGWPHCDGVRMHAFDTYVHTQTHVVWLSHSYFRVRWLPGARSRAPFVAAFHSDTFGSSSSSLPLLLCLRVLICDMMAMGKYVYMQPKNGLCISFTLPVSRIVALSHTHTHTRTHIRCSLFLSLSCASVQCRLHISLYIPRVCVLSTHTLSYAICVIGYERSGDQKHTHAHTQTAKRRVVADFFTCCCWRFLYIQMHRFCQKKNEKENITHKSIRRLFFGQWCIFIFQHCFASKHKWVRVRAGVCVRMYSIFTALLSSFAYTFFHSIWFYIIHFFRCCCCCCRCCQTTLKFAHNYILNNLNRQREQKNEKLEKFVRTHMCACVLSLSRIQFTLCRSVCMCVYSLSWLHACRCTMSNWMPLLLHRMFTIQTMNTAKLSMVSIWLYALQSVSLLSLSPLLFIPSSFEYDWQTKHKEKKCTRMHSNVD